MKLVDGIVEYEVERIPSRKTKNVKTSYFVKWMGYPEHEITCELEK